ncbi:MAG: hypothetical protein Q6M04_12120, partial [Thermostichus sp. BF3_bins_97]
LEGKLIRREVGGAGHGCETIFISTSESDPKCLVMEKDKIYGDIKVEVDRHQFIVSVLTEALAFYEKLDALFPRPDSLIKEDVIRVKSVIRELERT